MSTKAINTSQQDTICDVCGRTLLRGEKLEYFVGGGHRYSVCELCKGRALHEGWVREGALPDFQERGPVADRPRRLFHRLRGRGERTRPVAPQTLDDELSIGDWSEVPESEPAPPPIAPPGLSLRERAAREPRHVRAVPSNEEQKGASAAEHFNRTEHRRTIAGVARSLGAPTVNLTSDSVRSSVVWIVVSWELCWYRYEVDLSDGSVQLSGQGYELSDLAEHEQFANAGADEHGQIIV
jgi:hypothetical protein